MTSKKKCTKYISSSESDSYESEVDDSESPSEVDDSESPSEVDDSESSSEEDINESPKQTRKLTDAIKKRIAGNQYFKCANSPDITLKGLGKYKCPLWEKHGIIKGSFDASGYDIDHIIEFSITGNDSDENLQALCPSCHRVKTGIFLSETSTGKSKPRKRKLKNEIDEHTQKSFDLSIKDIINLWIGIDESDYNMDSLLKKYLENSLNDETKQLIVRKYLFQETFGITNTKNKSEFERFLTKYYSKEKNFKWSEIFFGYNPKYHDVNSNKSELRNNIIIDLLNTLTGKNRTTYKLDKFPNIIIENNQYTKAIKFIIKKSILFADESNRKLFLKKNKVELNTEDIRCYVNTIQSVLASHNIILMRGPRVSVNGSRVYNYQLYFDEEVKNIIEFKYGITDKVDNFPKIFKR